MSWETPLAEDSEASFGLESTESLDFVVVMAAESSFDG
jgi:hypothetical protein